ncbi:MAG: iron ABC transporter permease, partial [Myxococcota bacterium]
MNIRALSLAAFATVVVALAPWWGPSLDASPQDAFIFWQLRWPRVLVGALAGAVLGGIGAVYQLLFGNPLATPSTVGTTAGATLGALAVAIRWTDAGPLGLTGAAFLGALASTAVVALVAFSGRARIDDVLLAGISVTLATSAIATGLQSVAGPRSLFIAAQWSLGQLPQVGYRGVLWLIAPAVLTTLLALGLARPLRGLTRGALLAESQGVSVRWVRGVALAVGAVAVGGVVAWCGPIPFVGLIVPHLVRGWLGLGIGSLLMGSVVLGASFVVAADGLG